jgi:hypothetical protein
LVCRGTCDAGKLLDSYSVERTAVGVRVLANAGRMTAMAVLRNHTAQAVRNLVAGFVLGLGPVRRAMADTMSEVSIGYPDSPLNGPDTHGLGGPSAGERVRPVAGQVPVGAGGNPRFALFAAPGEALSELLRDFADLLDPMVRPPLGSGGVWLVRPDGYAACVVKESDVGAIAGYLRGLEQDVPVA